MSSPSSKARKARLLPTLLACNSRPSRLPFIGSASARIEKTRFGGFFVVRFRVADLLPCFPLATGSKKGTLVVPHFLVRFLTGAG